MPHSWLLPPGHCTAAFASTIFVFVTVPINTTVAGGLLGFFIGLAAAALCLAVFLSIARQRKEMRSALARYKRAEADRCVGVDHVVPTCRHGSYCTVTAPHWMGTTV